MMEFLIVALIVVAIVLFLRLADANKRIELLEENVVWMRGQLDWLRKKIREQRIEEPAESGSQPPAETKPEPVVRPQPAVATPEKEPVVEMPATEPEPIPAAAFTAHEPAATTAAAPASAPVNPPTPPPPTTPLSTAFPSGGSVPKRPSFDWEGLVGVKLFSWIAGVALVLAAVFFLRYSVQQGWLSPAIRATIGLLTGSALIVVCELRVARSYTFTANALNGAAIAILYATLFATHALWHLISPVIVFPLMIVVTAVAVMLSIRRNSVFIALLGLIGGFATPALLSSGENRPLSLFGYLLLLNIGLALVGYRKRWPVLTGFSIVLTVFYQWGWIARFLTPSQMPLAAGIFLVFAATAGAALWVGRNDDEEQSTFDQAAVFGSSLPLLFGIFAAAVPAYGARYNLLFGFLLLITAGLGAIAFTRGPQWLHVLGGGTALLVFALWFGRSWAPAAWPGIVGWIVAFVAMYLAFATRFESDGVFAAPVLFFTFGALVALGAGKGAALLIFATIFVLLAATAALAMWRERGPIYYIAAFFTIAAEAIWSAKYLDAGRLIAGLAIYGIFALFFLGVPVIAKRLGRRMAPRGALAMLVVSSIVVLLFLTTETVADSALWGLAMLLAILNLGALIESRGSSQPLLAAVSMILSWIVIAVWWSNATIGAAIVPALVVVGAFSVLVVLGNLWAARDSAERGEFENGVYLALVGHLFLLFVATQTSLAIPPWPLFAILALLDLALGAAALYMQRARLFTAPLAASQVILLVWCTAATQHNWPHVTLVATLAVSALGIVWFVIHRGFAESAVAALLGSYVVTIAAGWTGASPLFGSLVASHAAITIALLAVAAVAEWHLLACVAAVMTAFATYLEPAGTPYRQFSFGLLLYAIVVAYPLLLGARAKRHIEPHLGAVLASFWFFFVAREAMITAKLGNIIGVLPVAEAVVLMLLLLRVLRSEPAHERLLSRLALVAGSALAFITVAVPLQLEKQWITIGWALEGAALVWLFTRIPHRGLLLWAGGLLGAVVIRLALNPAVLSYHEPSGVAVFNWFLYTYLICAVAMFVAARFAPRDPPWSVAALNSAGTLLLFLLLNIEIADFYSRGPTLTFNFFSSSLAQDLTYTIGWALFAMIMLVAGIVTATRPARVAAVILLLVTILKCFLHDLPRLGGLYRVGSLLGLAASLVATGILLQKYVTQKPKQEAPAP